VQFTCSKTDQFLSQADELQVKFRILEANFLRFGVLVPWFSHHFAAETINNYTMFIVKAIIINLIFMLDSLIHLD
jgi:hypothetical protein